MEEKMEHILMSFRAKKEIKDLLEEISRKSGRSKSYLINRAIQMYLEDIEDIEIVENRLMDTTDKIMPLKESRKKYILF